MSSFFTLPASQKKRKRRDAELSASVPKRQKGRETGARARTRDNEARRRSERDDSISGSDSANDSVNDAGSAEDSSSSSDAEAETAAERRLKLAERYLENVRADVREGQDVGFDAEDVDRDLIAARLKEDVSEEKGRLYQHLARTLDYERASQAAFSGSKLATTGVAVCLPYAYTVSKDISLVKWELVRPRNAAEHKMGLTPTAVKAGRRRKPRQIVYTRGNTKKAKNSSYQHHTSPILCVAASSDGRFVVTGGADRKLIVWEPETLKPLKIFMQHRDSVTGLAFRGKTNQLFSASKDRTIKIWSLNELAYVETLFGHQDEVLDVAAVGGTQERCVSVGARDRTARLWKVVEESQLVFRGGGGGGGKGESRSHEDHTGGANGFIANGHAALMQSRPRTLDGSLDRIIQVDTQLFVTGSDSGALSLYGLHKKKPLYVLPYAHGVDPAVSVEDTYAEVALTNRKVQGQPTPRWITAMACIPYSDLFVTGSWDGCIRVWKISEDQRSIESVAVLGCLPQFENGIVNGFDKVGRDASQRYIKGVINDLAVVERGDRGKHGVCIIAGIGTESRLGRWLKVKGTNGAVIFEISPLGALPGSN